MYIVPNILNDVLLLCFFHSYVHHNFWKKIFVSCDVCERYVLMNTHEITNITCYTFYILG